MDEKKERNKKMIAIFNAQGENVGFIPERVFQGSNKANSVYFMCPIANTNVVSVAFSFHDGTTSQRHVLSVVESGAEGIFDGDGEEFNVWRYDIPVNVTKEIGEVVMQFYIATSSGEIISTEGITFTVERGVRPLSPEETDAYEELTETISDINSDMEQAENDIDANASAIVGLDSRLTALEGLSGGAQSGKSFTSYSAMISELNSADADEYGVGQSFYIETVNVPDVWVSKIESTSSNYTFLGNSTVENALKTSGFIQVGYYRLCALESQKVDLTNYLAKSHLTCTENADGTADLTLMIT